MTGTDMESRNRIVAENSGLHRLFTLGPSRVSLTGKTVKGGVIMDRRGGGKRPVVAEQYCTTRRLP